MWPPEQVRFELVNGFPVFGSGLTPFTLTVPQALVETCVFETCDASCLPLAAADVAGTNKANDASATTPRSPAGSRKLVRNVLRLSARTPRTPT